MSKFSNRKFLYVILCVILISILSLTLAYAALFVSLNINGNAEVVGSNWDIYLANIKVNENSVSGDEPFIINSKEVSFTTNLVKPGDFYEFTVDVVNGGTIDAMIESVEKTPVLSSEQAKYFSYIVQYESGEAVTVKQLVGRESFVRLKVRVEYRNDLIASDLPSSTETLKLGFTVNYIQSDNSSVVVPNNGRNTMYIASGSIYEQGSKICIGDECFIVYKNDGETVYLLAEFNLYVGSKYDNGTIYEYGDEATGLQHSSMLGWISSDPSIRNGLITYSDSNYWSGSGNYPTYVFDEKSNLYTHVEKYKEYLLSQYSKITNVRLITYEELLDLKCIVSSRTCKASPSWVYSSTYWTGSAYNDNSMYGVDSNAAFSGKDYTYARGSGIRPVIEIPVSAFMN